MNNISERVIEALNNWHNQEKNLNFIKARIKAVEEELERLEKEKYQIESKEKYLYTDIAIKEHKYWTNNNRTCVVKIGDIEKGEFFYSDKEKKDKQYFSSSLGILWHGDNPITKEEYIKIYNSL